MSNGNEGTPVKIKPGLKEQYGTVRNTVNAAVTNAWGRIKLREQKTGEKTTPLVTREIISATRHGAFDTSIATQEEVNQAKKERDDALLHVKTDALTHLTSAAIFEKTLQKTYQQAQRDKQPLRYIELDIDDFRNFNKMHGRKTGDKVLRKVGEAILGSIRGADEAGRLGGEEFGVIVRPSVEQDPTNPVPAERIRSAIESIDSERFDMPVTASVGIAELIPGESLDGLRDRTDVAQRLAKKLGKNRTVQSVLDPKYGIIYRDLSISKDYQVTLSDKNVILYYVPIVR